MYPSPCPCLRAPRAAGWKKLLKSGLTFRIITLPVKLRRYIVQINHKINVVVCVQTVTEQPNEACAVVLYKTWTRCSSLCVHSTVRLETAAWITVWRCLVSSSVTRSSCWVSFELWNSGRTSSCETESTWRLSSVSFYTRDLITSQSSYHATYLYLYRIRRTRLDTFLRVKNGKVAVCSKIIVAGSVSRLCVNEA